MLVGDADLEPSSVPVVDRRHSGTEAADGLPPTPEQVHADGGVRKTHTSGTRYYSSCIPALTI